jgi:asparagine synthase (glutamine-hydrolysing)
MSGICAVRRLDSPELVEHTLALVTGGLSLDSRDWLKSEWEQEIGVGLAARFDGQNIYRSSRFLIACDADLQNVDELQALAGDREPAGERQRIAALLAGLYERFGCAFVEKLRGAFSVVIGDCRDQRLMAAVDHIGIKRLSYFQDTNVVLIGSRIDALMQSGEISPEVNPRAIANVLNFSVSPGPETAFARVRRIPPGSMLVVSNAGARVQQYWDMSYGIGSDQDEARLSHELEGLVERSVARHCTGQPFDNLGAFLSGGTDSSTVVGMMARMKRGHVKTFSIGFCEQPFNELEYAEIAAIKFKSDHHTYLVGPDDCLEALPHMVRYFDEPFGNSSAIPTYFCARLAAQNSVKVLLAGDGGDELFGGNEAYRVDKLFDMYQRVPAVLRKGLVEPLLSVLPTERGLVGKAQRYVRRSNMPRIQRSLSSHFLSVHPWNEIFEPDFLRELAGYSLVEVLDRYYSQAPARDPLDRRLYSDVKTVLGDSDLPKVTMMCELAGIQPRFPFLDRSVAEFSGRIPARLKVKGLEKRYLFKRAFRNLLPIEIIRKRKHGFGIPVAPWLKSNPRMRELARDTLLSQTAFGRGYFRRGFIEDLFRKHEADPTTFYGDILWNFLVLELWHRQFVDEAVRLTA